ncbi:uncharacterized protein FYW61_019138 [Anableps anableps]
MSAVQSAESSDVDSSGESDRARDDEWNPDPELPAPKKTRKNAARAGVKRTDWGVSYRQLGGLVRHGWLHVSDPQSVCGVKFESADRLKEHFRSHRKLYGSSHCETASGFTFISTQVTFKCSVCSETFPKKALLNNHRWAHVENKPHESDVCLKSFGLKSLLEAHRKLNTNGYKHKCNICHKPPANRRSVMRHLSTHSSEWRYGCEICGKQFKLPTSLKQHKKIHTVRDQSLLCHICGKAEVPRSEAQWREALRPRSHQKRLRTCAPSADGASVKRLTWTAT